MDSKLVLIVTHHGSDIPFGDFTGEMSKLGLLIEEISDINGIQRPADFYLNHLLGEQESPADVRILIAGMGVPILQLVSKLPNLDAAFTTDPNYKNIVAIGGPRLVRAYYIPAPNGNPDSGTKTAQMILSRLGNMNYANAPPTTAAK